MTKSDKILKKITELLTPYLLLFIKDPNASHILIKFATVIKPPHTNLIYSFLANDILDIATQKHSCSALQKCLDVANDQQKLKIYLAVVENANMLITDQFGNYIIQYIIGNGNYEINCKLIRSFCKTIIFLSKQKFSSNVIEKCFDFCDEKGKLLIIISICESNKAQELLLDMYGNYGKYCS